MISSQELQGRWNEIKGGLRQKFGQITDDEFERVGGNVDQLVGFLERKTGQARKTIETFLDKYVDQGRSMAHDVAQTAQEYVGAAGESLRKGYEHVASNVREGLGQTQEVIRRSPIESLAIALGAGLVVGAVLGLMIGRSR